MIHRLLLAAGLVVVTGCLPATRQRQADVAQRDVELTAAQQEARHLTDVVQLTFGRDFERAGEAYFSRDMRWIVFQAIPRGERNYQMYVARLVRVGGQPAGLVAVTRVSPPDSSNTCGWFTDNDRTLVFASTAGKHDPDEPAPGYQRQGRDYRWMFSPGMEIYVVPGWQARVAGAVEGAVNLALPEYRLTDNGDYDAECAASPDGRHIVFCSDRPSVLDPTYANLPAVTAATGATTRHRQLYVLDRTTGETTQLTATPGYNGGPFFSPDGRRLVYRSDRVGNNLLQVYVADVVRDRTGRIVGLRNERPVTSDGNVNWAPYFSPDGRWIYYASSKVSHANYEIFARRVAADRRQPADSAGQRGETRITFAPGPDVLPVTSPDGRFLMWSSRRGDDPSTQIYIARLRPPAAR